MSCTISIRCKMVRFRLYYERKVVALRCNWNRLSDNPDHVYNQENLYQLIAFITNCTCVNLEKKGVYLYRNQNITFATSQTWTNEQLSCVASTIWYGRSLSTWGCTSEHYSKCRHSIMLETIIWWTNWLIIVV